MSVTRTLQKINPATGKTLASYSVAGPSEVAEATRRVRQALAVFQALPGSPLRLRQKLLKAMAEKLYRYSDRLARMISDETGKSLADALEGDIGTALNILNYYAEVGPGRLKPRAIRPDLVSLITFRSHWETYHPRGVIGIISPWNYPLAIPVSGIAAALMAGNAVILKPSELAPGTGEALAALFREVLQEQSLSEGLENLIQVVTGDGETGASLVEADVDGIIFTGSGATGRKIQSRLTERGLWSSLELGGSDAMLVLPGCDLEKVASYALWGRFVNAGQACAAVKRLLIPAADFDRMLALLTDKISRLVVGPPEDTQAHVGPLISATQLEVLEKQVAEAVSQGACVHMGGHRLPGEGYFYAPTLLSWPAGACENAQVLREEVFGPVLPVLPYHSVEEAVQLVNDSDFGLTASVFGPAARARELAGRLHCGTVVINDVGPSNYAMVCAPWGGWKQSGQGVSHGEWALLELSRMQIISRNGMYNVPLLGKPMWHFGKSGEGRKSQTNAVLAFAARHPRLFSPLTWLAFWRNRASTRI